MFTVADGADLDVANETLARFVAGLGSASALFVPLIGACPGEWAHAPAGKQGMVGAPLFGRPQAGHRASR